MPIRVKVVPRRGLNRLEAARYVGISTSKFDELVREGQMPQPFRIGSRTIYDLRKLDAAFDVLSGAEEGDGFTGWEDWDQSQPEPVKGRQVAKHAAIDAHALVIQDRKDARGKAQHPPTSEKHPGHPNVYTPESLAERWSCSAQHVRNMIRRGDLHAFLHGGKLTRIKSAAVIDYETANTIMPTR